MNKLSIAPVAYVNGALTNITNTTPDDVLHYTEINDNDILCSGDEGCAYYTITPYYDIHGTRLGIFVETIFWNEYWNPDDEGVPTTVNGPEYLIPIPA